MLDATSSSSSPLFRTSSQPITPTNTQPASSENLTEAQSNAVATEAVAAPSVQGTFLLGYLPNVEFISTAAPEAPPTKPVGPADPQTPELKKPRTPPKVFPYKGTTTGKTTAQGLPEVGSVYPAPEALMPFKATPDAGPITDENGKVKKDVDDAPIPTKSVFESGDIEYFRDASLTGYTYTITDKDLNRITIVTDANGVVTETHYDHKPKPSADLLKGITNKKQLAVIETLVGLEDWKGYAPGETDKAKPTVFYRKDADGKLEAVSVLEDGTVRVHTGMSRDGKFYEYIDIDKDGKQTPGRDPLPDYDLPGSKP